MGKKKKQKHVAGWENASQGEHSQNAGKVNGFSKKKSDSKKKIMPEIKNDLQTNGKKKLTEECEIASTNGRLLQESIYVSGSKKRKLQAKRKQDNKKPKYEPGRFVRPPPSSESSSISGSPEETKKKKKKRFKQKNNEKSLCKFEPKNEEDLGSDDTSSSEEEDLDFAGYPNWLYNPGDHYSSSDTDFSCESEDSFTSDDESMTLTDEMSPEDAESFSIGSSDSSSFEEEIYTETSFDDSSNPDLESFIGSEDDTDYDPGEKYDDVIIQRGEAKYIEANNIAPEKNLFQDESVSQIVDYFSDTNNEPKNPSKSSEATSGNSLPSHLDTSRGVVTVPDVRLDKPPKTTKPDKSPYTQRPKSVTCSRKCAHNHTDQNMLPQGSSKERPISFLKHDNDNSIEEKSPVNESAIDPQDFTENPEASAEIIQDLDQEDQESIKIYNAIDSYHVVAHLTESIHFHGNLSIELVVGKASVMGYSLSVGEKVTVNAPTGHSSVDITPVASESTDGWIETLKDKLKDLFFESDLKEIQDNLQSLHAIVLLHKTSNSRVKMVEKYSQNRVFPNMISYRRPRPFAATEYILQCRFSLGRRFNFHPNPDWQWISVSEESKIVVIGGKNVGKSSLVRYLINRNLKNHGKILLVDLDIGQPEFFVPQTVSATLIEAPILGMGCFTEKDPEVSYLFGDLNVANAPQRYFECVSKLLKTLCQDEKYRNIPWVINTMGYVKGVGLELMVTLLRLISPTDVVQITHNIPLENFEQEITTKLVNDWNWTILKPVDCHPCGDFKTFLYQTMVSDNMAVDIRKAKGSTTREINILANLGGILGDNCDWITQSPPVFAPLEKLKIFNFTDQRINEEHNMDLLNANLVYLCERSDDRDILQCFGIGIVRGIDENQKTVYLLPSTRSKLPKVNSLAICNITLPPQLILNQNSGIRGDLSYVYNTDEAAGSRNVVTRPFRGEKAMSNIYSKNQPE